MMKSSIDLDPSSTLGEDSGSGETLSLAEKITLTVDEVQEFDPIPAQLLRKVFFKNL